MVVEGLITAQCCAWLRVSPVPPSAPPSGLAAPPSGLAAPPSGLGAPHCADASETLMHCPGPMTVCERSMSHWPSGPATEPSPETKPVGHDAPVVPVVHAPGVGLGEPEPMAIVRWPTPGVGM